MSFGTSFLYMFVDFLYYQLILGSLVPKSLATLKKLWVWARRKIHLFSWTRPIGRFEYLEFELRSLIPHYVASIRLIQKKKERERGEDADLRKASFLCLIWCSLICELV